MKKISRESHSSLGQSKDAKSVKKTEKASRQVGTLSDKPKDQANLGKGL